jgi:ferrochelatase
VQTAALEAAVREAGHALPVFAAYRHWAPWTTDVLRQIAGKGLKQGLLLVLAPHQSSVSWDWYIKTVAEAEESLEAELGDATPHIVQVLNPWWTDTGYVQALEARVQEICKTWTQERRDAAAFIFTAHAIPKTIEDTSTYRQQFAETAAAVAVQLGLVKHHIAFQSMPDPSTIPWSTPGILEVIRDLHQQGVKEIVVQAAGFLVDHIEVLYDLDYEAKALADELGMVYHRAPCVHAHPLFVGCLKDRVLEALQAYTPA